MKHGYLKLILTMILFLAFAGTSYAFDYDFHGKMWQVFGATDNAAAMPHSQKSGKTDFFSYNGILNDKGLTKDKNDISTMYSVMGENEDAVFGLTKARLRFEGKTDDGLAKIVYGLEVGTYNWGDTKNKFGLSGDGKNQETRFAYAEVTMPVVGGKIRAGLQPTKINKWVWSETAPGLTYHFKAGDWKTMAGWYRGEDDKITNGGDNDYLIIKIDNKLTANTTLGLFGIYADLDTTETSEKYTHPDDSTKDIYDTYDSDTCYIGLTGKFKNDALFGDFDIIHQFGDIDVDINKPSAHDVEDLNRTAWLGNLTVGYKITDNFKISGNVLYVSGDDDPNDGKVKNFDSIDVDVKIGTIFFKDTILADCDRTISDAPYIMDKGLINYAVQGDWQIDEKNNLRFAVRYLTTDEDLELNTNEKKDDELGYEFDLWYTYQLNKYVQLKIDAAYLAAGDGADHLARVGDDPNDYEHGDDIYKLATGIKIKF